MATEFAVGNEVKFKGGGPRMIVSAIVIDQSCTKYECQWFAGRLLQNARFTADMLELWIDLGQDIPF